MMDKALAVKMGNEMMAAAQEIAKKYGYEVKRGSGKYDSSSYKMNNIEFFKPSDVAPHISVSRESGMAASFNAIKRMYGLGNVSVGDSYYSVKNGSEMKLVGWDSKKRKYPVIVQCVANGKTYKMSAAAFKMAMELGE